MFVRTTVFEQIVLAFRLLSGNNQPENGMHLHVQDKCVIEQQNERKKWTAFNP